MGCGCAAYVGLKTISAASINNLNDSFPTARGTLVLIYQDRPPPDFHPCC